MRPSQFIDAIALCLVVPACWCAAAIGQQSADPMDVCYQLTDVQQRVACYDHEVQRRRAASASAIAPAAAAPAAAAAQETRPVAVTSGAAPAVAASADTLGLDGRQLDLARKARGIQPVAITPIIAVLSRLQPRPGHQYYFELENGQLWESTDSEPDLFLSPHETVTVRPGILGAFFLKTQEGNLIRVHRLR